MCYEVAIKRSYSTSTLQCRANEVLRNADLHVKDIGNKTNLFQGHETNVT